MFVYPMIKVWWDINAWAVKKTNSHIDWNVGDMRKIYIFMFEHIVIKAHLIPSHVLNHISRHTKTDQLSVLISNHNVNTSAVLIIFVPMNSVHICWIKFWFALWLNTNLSTKTTSSLRRLHFSLGQQIVTRLSESNLTLLRALANCRMSYKQ